MKPRQRPAWLFVALSFLLLGCSSSESDTAAPTTSVESTTSSTSASTSTTEATTTTSEPVLSDEEQVLELHREYIVDLYTFDERSETHEQFLARMAWLKQNATETFAQSSIAGFESWRADDVIQADSGNLSHVVEYKIDGDQAVVRDCVSSVARTLDGTLESRSSRTTPVFVEMRAVRTGGSWKVDGLELEGSECDPTRAWVYQPPVVNEDEAAILRANAGYMDFEERSGSDPDYDAVGAAEDLMVDPMLARVLLVFGEGSDAPRTGASLEFRVESVSQRKHKAVVKSCVDYTAPTGTEDVYYEPNYWNVYLHQEGGRWFVEGAFSGGQDSCQV